MSKRKKNNIIIGSLLAVVLLMAVGYAAFSTVLNIQGTGSISSSWNIKITNVEVSNIVGEASDAEGTTWEDLTATINSNLVSPGDSITYDVTIRNDGTLDAVLTDINLSESINPAISFSTSNLTEGTELGAGEEAILKVTVTYNDVTSQPEDTTASLDMTLTYEQKGSETIIPGEDTITTEDLTALVVTEGDGLYEDSYEEGRYIYKGANPNNYVVFSGEIWRIISIENDNMIKLISAEPVETLPYDETNHRNNEKNTFCTSSEGCSVFAAVDGIFKFSETALNFGTVTENSTINEYLNNEYYNNLDLDARNKIQTHTFNIGAIDALTDSSKDSMERDINLEKSYTWTGNIGLISLTDVLKASNNSLCTSLSSVLWEAMKNKNFICDDNYLYLNDLSYWTLTPGGLDGYAAPQTTYQVVSSGGIGSIWYDPDHTPSNTKLGIRPAIYLTSDITLSGTGSLSDPYVVK